MSGSLVPVDMPCCPHIPRSEKCTQIGPCVEMVGVLFRKAALMVPSAIGGALLGPFLHQPIVAWGPAGTICVQLPAPQAGGEGISELRAGQRSA